MRALKTAMFLQSVLGAPVDSRWRTSRDDSNTTRTANGGSQPFAAPAAGRCLATNWPEFKSSAELSGTPWGAYFEKVYGAIPDGDGVYPLCVGEFW